VTKKLNGDKKRESGGKKQFPNIVPRARAPCLALTDLGLCRAARTNNQNREPTRTHSARTMLISPTAHTLFFARTHFLGTVFSSRGDQKNATEKK